MNGNDAKEKENNGGKKGKNHSHWLNDLLRALWEDVKTKICELKTWLEIAAFGVVVTYTFVSCNQWKEMRRTNNLTEISIKNTQNNFIETGKADRLKFRLERRPYVGIVEPIPHQKLKAGKLSATVRNYGVTPARAVYAHGVFKKEFTNEWRYDICMDFDKSMDWEKAGPAIFQGTEQPLEITIDRETPSPTSYLAVCVTFMDIDGPFQWTFEHGKWKGQTRNSPYAISHLFEVRQKNGELAFTKIATSVETAQPRE